MKKTRFSLHFKIILLIELVIIISNLGIFYWLHYSYEKAVYKSIRNSAKAIFQQLVITRQWVAEQKGVYVEKTPGIAVNPYLKQIPAVIPEVKDEQGRTLVLKNPAIMTKELSAIGQEEQLFKFHITSLELMNPENKPDEFETKALQSFEQGAKEAERFERINGEQVYRYMAPIYITQDCLQCHGYQKYKIGDIRGGISVYLPAQETVQHLNNAVRKQWVIFLLVVLIVMFLLIFFINKNILSPIDKLHVAVRTFEKGDLSYRVNVATNDELQDLAEAINKMAGTLKEDQDKLIKNEKLAAIGTLAASIGHELRNPLTGLKTLVYYIKHWLEAKVLNTDTTDIKIPLEQADKEINNMANIIQNLLDFAKTSALNITACDINGLLGEVINNIPLPANITLVKNFADLPAIQADKDKLKIVFANLIVNAIQSIGDNIGQLTITSKYLQGMAEIEIRDTGCGIKEEHLAKVFEPLFTTKTKGIGLGLAVSKAIIDRHKGTILVASKEDSGTSFIIKLPPGEA